MNDMELAEEIESGKRLMADHSYWLGVSKDERQQIIAALRRGPERQPSGEMVEMRKVRKVLVNFDIEAAVDDYEFRGDEGDYTPNEKDRVLLTDFAHGFIGELCEALGKLSAAEAEGRKS